MATKLPTLEKDPAILKARIKEVTPFLFFFIQVNTLLFLSQFRFHQARGRALSNQEQDRRGAQRREQGHCQEADRGDQHGRRTTRVNINKTLFSQAFFVG